MSALMLTKEQALELLEKIINCEGSEAEIDEWIDLLSNGVPHPNISDLIFHPDRERTPSEIIDIEQEVNMVLRLDWIPANIDDNSDIPMLQAISDLMKTFKPQACPICLKEKIRFYYIVSDFQPNFMIKNGQIRGTVWVWCPNCLHWTHGSGTQLPKNIIYVNNLDELELKQVKGHYMIDNLNRLWDKGRLSESFTEKP